ncbi:hypothetical protein X737_38730 [Mesorhizobium sp. L48C026A00]|nr:hypothetical protein X737_38730 [Mesorhizobium sp. L48C026A00]
MLEAVFLWFRDHKIFGPSDKEMERLVRSERQRFLETFLAVWRTGSFRKRPL